jgi:dihydroxyacetone kinase-like protein
MRTAAEAIQQERDYLTQLDAAIGDADHGANMSRGFAALSEWLDAIDDAPVPGRLLIGAGNTLVSTIGGASGPLWGSALRRAGESLGDAEEFDGEELAKALEEALAAVVELGTASEGDKTMVDTLAPASQALRRQIDAGATVSEALVATREAGEAGMRATAMLQARKGRALYLGERSIGHQDPGATSTALILGALEGAVNRQR